MGSQGMFEGSISILKKGLDLRSLRHNLIVSNIANKDTPNYKAFDLAIEEALQKTDDSAGNLSLKKTHSAHFPPGGSDDIQPFISRASTVNRFEKRGDGNTVDVEKEMANLAENNLIYDAMAQIIRKKFQGLKTVIQGGGK